MKDSSHRFLLKVWCESGNQPEWHAVLRDVVDGTLHEFTATEALVTYLTSLDGTADNLTDLEEEVE
ncbi:MAG TPA: hypothetical protein PLU66_04315 [Trueperaceae bacterium]|nr:hypothetical protein [Trueperaceae bacterium]HRQ11153.1 hypothetical protein [Trueperaceae bacterium]